MSKPCLSIVFGTRTSYLFFLFFHLLFSYAMNESNNIFSPVIFRINIKFYFRSNRLAASIWCLLLRPTLIFFSYFFKTCQNRTENWKIQYNSHVRVQKVKFNVIFLMLRMYVLKIQNFIDKFQMHAKYWIIHSVREQPICCCCCKSEVTYKIFHFITYFGGEAAHKSYEICVLKAIRSTR